MKLFEYAIFLVPKKDGSKDKAKILVDKTTVLAENQDKVNILAARAIPSDYLGRLEEVQIAVRPF